MYHWIMRTCLIIIASLIPQLVLAQSQGEMNRTSLREFEAADKRLNTTYEKVISTLDEQGKEKLRASERAWLTYRDAQAIYEADSEARGGSMAPLIRNTCSTALTEARIKELEGKAATN